jgi:hypothetical protein
MAIWGYAGEIPVYAHVVVDQNLIWVDEEVWTAIGRDYDGDLCYIIDPGELENVVNLDWVKKHYVLPAKKENVDNRDSFETLFDILRSSRLCGQVYNWGKRIVDAAYYSGMKVEDVLILEAQIMSTFVQPVIDGFKYASTKDITLDSILVKFDVLHLKPVLYKLTGYFMALRGTKSMKINDVEVPRLKAIKMLALTAKADSLSFYERMLAKLVDLKV